MRHHHEEEAPVEVQPLPSAEAPPVETPVEVKGPVERSPDNPERLTAEMANVKEVAGAVYYRIPGQIPGSVVWSGPKTATQAPTGLPMATVIGEAAPQAVTPGLPPGAGRVPPPADWKTEGI